MLRNLAPRESEARRIVHPRQVEQNQSSAATVNYAAISIYLKRNVVCPSGGVAFSDSYTVTDCQTKPVCQKVSSTHILPN